MNYEMNELLPVVANLTEKYTAGQSTSVTYERAQKLMEAVLYCVEEFERLKGLAAEKISAQMAYEIGYERILDKTKKVKEEYHVMMKTFQAYGNKNYYDTVTNAISGFFLYYDIRFAPQETIITMDYPVFEVDRKLEGIDIISQYIDAIWEEQCYLMKFPRNYIISELRSFHPRYEKEFFNLKEILQLQMATGNSD